MERNGGMRRSEPAIPADSGAATAGVSFHCFYGQSGGSRKQSRQILCRFAPLEISPFCRTYDKFEDIREALLSFKGDEEEAPKA